MKKLLLLAMAVVLVGCVGVEPWTSEKLIEFERQNWEDEHRRINQAFVAGQITKQARNRKFKLNMDYLKRHLDLIVVERHPLQKRSSYRSLSQGRDLSWSQEQDLERAARIAESDAYFLERRAESNREMERMIDDTRRRDAARRGVPNPYRSVKGLFKP